MDLAQKPVYKLDLAAGTSVVNLTTPLVEGDDRAQTFILELTDKGAPANLNGYSVTAYFGRGKTAEAEADTIPVSGTVSGNVATITLTESCYSRSCYFSMPIRLSNGATGQKRTYLIVRGTVVKSVDGTIIDPDGSVPSLDDLFAQIAVMERSRQAAEEATEEALASAARADEAREGIQGDLAALTEEIANERAGLILLDELTIPAGDNTKHYFGVEIDRSYHYEIVLESTGNADGWFTIQPQSGGTGDEHNSSNRAVELLKPGEKMKLVEPYTPTGLLRRPVYVQSQGGQSCTAKIYRYEDEYVEAMKNRFNTFIVDEKATGYGIYNDLYAAFYKLKERYDATTPCTILIRKGEYTLDASNATENTRWSVLWTGQRDISFIGEDREHTIISMTNNVGYSARIFDITGKCKIANLTIKNLMGAGWDGPRSHNPYAIHNDGVYAADAPYDTVIENCHIYSEMFTPVGAGLQSCQRQVYKDCTFEFVGTDSNLSQWGALYIHSPADSTAANCSVLVDNCTMISRNGTKAITLPDVAGSLQYTDIPVTIRRCIGYTNGATVTDVNKERCNITEDSALNNIDDWNY